MNRHLYIGLRYFLSACLSKELQSDGGTNVFGQQYEHLVSLGKICNYIIKIKQ